MWNFYLLRAGILSLLVLTWAPLTHAQRYRDFRTSAPLSEDQVLIIGFMGGRESWNNDRRGVRKLALKLRGMNLPGVYVETIENKNRRLAIELITKAFDRDRNGRLEEAEKGSVRLIVYGQSFGGAAVVKLARQLQKMDVPVLLTVQVDSVGRSDKVIPANVARAANLFQRDGFFIKGEREIRAEDPSQTKILGNFKFDYSKKKIDLSEVSWLKRLFQTAHTKMDHDPEVWVLVEKMILNVIEEENPKSSNRISRFESRASPPVLIHDSAFVRVVSCDFVGSAACVAKDAIHEITRNYTNEHQGAWRRTKWFL